MLEKVLKELGEASIYEHTPCQLKMYDYVICEDQKQYDEIVNAFIENDLAILCTSLLRSKFDLKLPVVYMDKYGFGRLSIENVKPEWKLHTLEDFVKKIRGEYYMYIQVKKSLFLRGD